MNVREIITGPMTSGKTGTIICRYLNSDSKKVMVSNGESVGSRNGDTVLRNCISHGEFVSMAGDGLLDPTVVYFIDEAQFIDNLPRIIEKSGSTFILSMLDMNYKGEYFPVYIKLRKRACKITILRATCDLCGSQAMYSMLTGSNETLDKTMYSACCGNCFNYPMDAVEREYSPTSILTDEMGYRNEVDSDESSDYAKSTTCTNFFLVSVVVLLVSTSSILVI